MKLVLTTNRETYYVPLPNYFDTDKIQQVLTDIKWELPKDVEVKHHQIYNDGPTNQERKELDLYGEVKTKMIKIDYSITEKLFR